jgi:hypothetical protein
MNRSGFLVCVLLVAVGCVAPMPAQRPPAPRPLSTAVIADHTRTDPRPIPDAWADLARRTFGVAYGASPLGRQLTAGLEHLELVDPRFRIDRTGRPGALAFFTGDLKGDLGTPDRYRWTDQTRFWLRKGWGDINMVMWSWGDELTRYTEAEVDLYLEQMRGLEVEFPDVVFVYMTAALDGTGPDGNVHVRNEQIRAFCRANHRVLFDVADIQRYDPDGVDYLARQGDFGAYYRQGGRGGNWADEWCDANLGACTPYACPRSRSLVCDRLAGAFWWMLVRLAGCRGDCP